MYDDDDDDSAHTYTVSLNTLDRLTPFISSAWAPKPNFGLDSRTSGDATFCLPPACKVIFMLFEVEISGTPGYHSNRNLVKTQLGVEDIPQDKTTCAKAYNMNSCTCDRTLHQSNLHRRISGNTHGIYNDIPKKDFMNPANIDCFH